MKRQFSVSDAALKMPREINGVAILIDVARKEATKRVEEAKEAALVSARNEEASIRETIRHYQEGFRSFGYECPLPGQFDRTLQQGFPTINRFVDTLLLCEMTTGILMGAQDYGQMRGELVFDLAKSGEKYDGMRYPCTCKDGEIIVRDDDGIVASYFQGSDRRTAITRQTSDVIFFSFGAPGIATAQVEAALQKAVAILGPAAADSQIELL